MSEKAKILIVEDDDYIRLTLRDYLSRLEYEVLVASDGAGAIEQLLDHEVDVIVSDYRMNVLGGEHWIRFLQRYCSDKKIFVTSGYLKPDFDIPFKVLPKPFDYSDLAKLIKESLAV